jgi:hypothetical protein
MLMAGCSQAPPPSGVEDAKAPAAAPKSQSPLQSEARGVAQQLIDKKYVACGDFRIYYPGAPQDPHVLIEMKGATFDIRSDPLSGADPLNHIEWRGSVIIKMIEAVPYRTRRRSNGAWGEWDEWEVGENGIRGGLSQADEFAKKNGQWFFVSNVVLGDKKIPRLHTF